MKKKILVIIADYYQDISNDLLKSTLNNLNKKHYSIKILKVPGVFEIPVTISRNIHKYNGFIALGCVIKGQTPHFDFISQSATDAIMKLSISSKKPIGNGIITAFNLKQAKERCGLTRSNKTNKGLEAAKAVMSIIDNGPKKI